MRKLLEALGFHVKNGSQGGHKTVTHPHLAGFMATGYNCKGGNNGTVDRNYVGKLIRVVTQYEEGIKEFLTKP